MESVATRAYQLLNQLNHRVNFPAIFPLPPGPSVLNYSCGFCSGLLFVLGGTMGSLGIAQLSYETDGTDHNNARFFNASDANNYPDRSFDINLGAAGFPMIYAGMTVIALGMAVREINSWTNCAPSNDDANPDENVV